MPPGVSDENPGRMVQLTRKGSMLAKRIQGLPLEAQTVSFSMNLDLVVSCQPPDPREQRLENAGRSVREIVGRVRIYVIIRIAVGILLRRVLKPRLIGVFVGVVAAGILVVGYIFNAVL